MTRSEMNYLDSALCGPLLLFLNQYFDTYCDEYYVLWICLVTLCFPITSPANDIIIFFFTGMGYYGPHPLLFQCLH